MKVLLVGAGKMGRAYVPVLKALGADVTVVGQSEDKIRLLREAYPTLEATSGGIDRFLTGAPRNGWDAGIVAVPIEKLDRVSEKLMAFGIRQILVEKPGALDVGSLRRLAGEAARNAVRLRIGYNRRFYESVRALKSRLAGIDYRATLHFEFNERVEQVARAGYPSQVRQRWVIANSSHVIDTAFFLAGWPKELEAKVSGETVMGHESGSRFSGRGTTEKGVRFTYGANWQEAGNWKIAVSAPGWRGILAPLERLLIEGREADEEAEIDYRLDNEFKPGLYRQVQAFLEGRDDEGLCRIEEQIGHLEVFERIGGYSSEEDEGRPRTAPEPIKQMEE